ncbi:hypothetical protein J0H58_01020 [bacterium]|nr:hypothetical protein [bacterium]
MTLLSNGLGRPKAPLADQSFVSFYCLPFAGLIQGYVAGTSWNPNE